MKSLPLAELEQLIAVPKYLADPARDRADLERRPASERQELWGRLRQTDQRYRGLLDSCEPDPYLESYLLLAQLKLAAVARAQGEPEPDGSAFSPAAFRFLDRLEELCVLDRLTPQELAQELQQPQQGAGAQGARLAAGLGLHLTTEIASDPSIPGPLAFAFRRLYRRRLTRAQEVARLYVETRGLPGLVQEMHWNCGGCQRTVLDADHVHALSQASLEVLIALAPPEQARMLAELARLKTMQGMDPKQILAALADRQPKALEALKELAAGAAASGQLELYERLVQEIKGAMASQQKDYRFSLEKLEGVVDKSLGTIKDVVYALSPQGAACPSCGTAHGAAPGG